MKIIDLLNSQPILQDLVNQRMPAKIAYCVAKNFRLISVELEDYNKTRLKLLSENWTLDPVTNKYDIPDNEQEKWKTIHNELLDSECDYKPFKIDISLIEKLDWSPVELLSLWFIFEGDGASDLAPLSRDLKIK